MKWSEGVWGLMEFYIGLDCNNPVRRTSQYDVFPCKVIVMNARKVFPSRVEDEWIGKTFLAWMTMTRQGKHHTVRSDLTGLTLLIITTKQSVTFYGKMYGKVQYRTPIPSHVPVKVNTVTCAGKGFVTPNKHDELPHSFYSTTDNNNYQQWGILGAGTIILSGGIHNYILCMVRIFMNQTLLLS